MVDSITSYEQAAKWIQRGRSPGGRKIRSFKLRMNDDAVIVISNGYQAYMECGSPTVWTGHDFAELRPGDIFTFTRDTSDMVGMSGSLSMVLWKVFGLYWRRAGKARYTVCPNQTHPPGAHEHFKGMEWNLTAGVCLNPRPSILAVVDNDKRKVWIAALKKFRRALHIGVKLGIVQSIIDSDIESYNWIHSELIAGEVLEAIKSGAVNTDLLNQLVLFAKQRSHYRVATGESVKRTAENIISNNRVEFRREFGVLQR